MEKEYNQSKEVAKKYLGFERDLGKMVMGLISKPDLNMLEDYISRGGEDEEYIQYLAGNALDPRD